jgi:hypothetical protein
MLQETIVGDLQDSRELTIRLEGYAGQSLRIVGALPSA